MARGAGSYASSTDELGARLTGVADGPYPMYDGRVEVVLAAFVLWFVWRFYANLKARARTERLRELQSRMRETLVAEHKWREGSWWHTEKFDVAKMIYSHAQGVDDQAWFTDYLAVRLGTDDWWLREYRSSRYVGADEEAGGSANHWFPAKRLAHDAQSFLDGVYLRCLRLFRSHPGLTPDVTFEAFSESGGSAHVWEPPIHADGQRVEKSWEAFQQRAKELEAYQAEALEQSDQCADCGVEDTVRDGRCNACGKILARVCGCGFTNMVREVTCKSCGRRLEDPAEQRA